MTSGRLSVTGADLYYETEGDGPAVVLLHGFSLDTRMWDSQVAALRDVATVVRLDMRGFGRSSVPDMGVPYSRADDIVSLLDHLGIASATVVGLSMGGGVATHMALMVPERVRGLVLLDALLDGVPWDDESERAAEQVAAVLRGEGPAAATRCWLEHPFFAPARRDPRLAALLVSLVEPYTWFHWLNDDPREAIDPSPYGSLEQITAPTRVVVGALDVPGFRTMSSVLADRIPGARMITVPDVGHMVNLEAPRRINAMLREVVTAAF